MSQLRNLYRSTAASPQGSLLMWIDIFTQSEAMKISPIDLPKSEKRKFEIRIVCWRSMDVSYKNRRALDLVATFYMEGATDRKRSTDVHWRCKTGQGSWNYRIKLPLELPIDSKEKSRLKVQLWNQALVRSSEIIGEQSINLYDWFLLAYRRGTTQVQPFKEIKDAMKAVGGFNTDMADGDDDDDDDDDGDNGQEEEKELADIDFSEAAARQQGNDDEDGDDAGDDNDNGDGDLESQPLLKKEKEKKEPISVTATPLKEGKGGSKGGASGGASGHGDKKGEEDGDEDMDDAVAGVQVCYHLHFNRQNSG